MAIKESAERDKREREALENLKMGLEAEKKKIEDALEAERSIALDKDALLERVKRHESELEESLKAAHEDYDALESKLQDMLRLKQRSEENHKVLKSAFDEAAEHLVRLEAEQASRKLREEELTKQLATNDQEIEALHVDLDNLHQENEALQVSAAQDVTRMRERTEKAAKEFEEKLSAERLDKSVLILSSA